MADAAIFDFEMAKFYWLLGRRGSRHKLCQNRSIGCEDNKIFSIIQDGGCRHLGFSKTWIFICWRYLEGPDASLYQFFLNRSFRYGDIAIFRILKMAAAAILDLCNREMLFTIGVQSCETHQHAKFCQNRSISCEDIQFFDFSRLRLRTHRCIKFRQNRSFHCGVIAIFQIFKIDFWNRKILLVPGVQMVETHQHAKFCQNRQSVANILRFFDFLRWRPSILVSITMQNLVMIDAVVFIIWTFQYLAHLAGKSLLTPQKFGFWGSLIS